jgi:hypothetical protein
MPVLFCVGKGDCLTRKICCKYSKVSILRKALELPAALKHVYLAKKVDGIPFKSPLRVSVSCSFSAVSTLYKV